MPSYFTIDFCFIWRLLHFKSFATGFIVTDAWSVQNERSRYKHTFSAYEERKKKKRKLHFDFVCAMEESIASAISPNNLLVFMCVRVCVRVFACVCALVCVCAGVRLCVPVYIWWERTRMSCFRRTHVFSGIYEIKLVECTIICISALNCQIWLMHKDKLDFWLHVKKLK